MVEVVVIFEIGSFHYWKKKKNKNKIKLNKKYSSTLYRGGDTIHIYIYTMYTYICAHTLLISAYRNKLAKLKQKKETFRFPFFFSLLFSSPIILFFHYYYIAIILVSLVSKSWVHFKSNYYRFGYDSFFAYLIGLILKWLKLIFF